MAAISASGATTITFRDKAALEAALLPLKPEEVVARIAAASTLTLKLACDETAAETKVVSLRNLGPGNLLKTELYKTSTLTVYYPENPRVPHHLTIALNRREVRGIADVTEVENSALFATIRKIAEIYKTIGITGFVIAQFDTPQLGHFDRYVVEVIPHLPGFNEVKNIVDKADSNRHVLYRAANLSPIICKIRDEDLLAHAALWQAAFQRESTPLSESDIKGPFPRTRKECYLVEAESVLLHHLGEILEDKGGKVLSASPVCTTMLTEMPDAVKTVTVDKCFFCEDSVIARQLVYEYEGALVFYNMRKGAKPGSDFLILPKRHTEKVYGLTEEEIRTTSRLRKALVEVLKEAHPECEVIIYSQDDPSVGQTVFHSHEQVVVIDPKTVALMRTMLHFSAGNVSPEEMRFVCEEFGLKIHKKIKEHESIVHEESA